MAEFKRAGMTATMWAVLIFFGVLVLVGILAWLRRTQHNVPTSPPRTSFSQPAAPATSAATLFAAP